MKREHYIVFFAVLFVLGCKPYRIQKAEKVNTPISATGSLDSSLYVMYKPYKELLDSSMNEVLNLSQLEMTTGSPEGLLGNFVCDLSLEVGNRLYKESTGETADFCLLNNGGLRTFLPKGEITRRKIYELMPFENELVVITLSPEKMVELFQYIGNKTVNGGTRKQGVPVSGNVAVKLKGNEPIEVLIDSMPLRGRNYKVITSDYLANGGDYMSFFVDPIKFEKVGIKLRDAIMQYVIDEQAAGNELQAEIDKRISYVE